MPKDSLEVTESGYLKAGDGPSEDTGAFYVPTPAPGVGREFDSRKPPSGRIAAATPLWIKRVVRPGSSDAEDQDEGGVSLLIFGTAAGGLVLVLFGLAVLGLWWMTPAPPEPIAEPVEPSGEERYQGLKVKKGLQ